MMNQDKPVKPKTRLYVPQPFSAGHSLTLDADQTHYLANVMRQAPGGAIAVFNGHQGEWLAEVNGVEQRHIGIKAIRQIALQKNSPDMWLAFAPVKNKLDVIVEKAVELGVSALLPVFTAHCVVKTLNHHKLSSYIVSAAEQSGRHDLPRVEEFKDIGALLAGWPKDRILFYGDESGGGENIKILLPSFQQGKYGVLIGPEGGFSPEERAMLRAAPFVTAFCMGPRILRADTAIIAALACVQAWLGDWDERPGHPAFIAGQQ